MSRIHLSPRLFGVGVLALVGVVAVLAAIAGVNEITGAQPARFSTIRGTIDSYEYLGNCHPELCFISDILQPLRDYQLTLHQETASATGQAFVVHPYGFNELPDLSAMVGATVSLTIGTDTTWSDSAGGDIPEVLAISVGGKMYSTPYAIHPTLRFWDWVATGIAWIAPLVAYAVILWLVMFPAGRTRPRDRNNVSPVRGTRRRDSSKHVENQWTDYAIVSYSAWLFVGLVGGYILRVRAGSVEFWLLLYA